MEDKITLNHGSGGKLSRALVEEVFLPRLRNSTLQKLTDAALIRTEKGHLAMTTDSFVVDPIFFPGGDIGKLAVCGTVNDLAVSGALPQYLSASFILEEGFEMAQLKKIVESMSDEAKKAGIQIVTGDTKVVHRGQCDKIFINTTGIGKVQVEQLNIAEGKEIQVGDKIIVNGGIGEHGVAILCEREELSFKTSIQSDCASLNSMIQKLYPLANHLRFMRDATRGGLATVLCELSGDKSYGVYLKEASIPVKEAVNGVCDLLGFDPLYIANEGKVVMVVSKEKSEEALAILKDDPLGVDSAIIGEITAGRPGLVVMETEIGGTRIVDMLSGDQLPRIC